MTRKLEKYCFSFKTKNANIYFVYKFRTCKAPERTKEYKAIKDMLNDDIISCYMFCTEKYYNENKYEFITNYI